ncbi:Signal transduction histidine kinase CheA [hydrothermal vent metagenome]|uniref:Chemotaxis protein CheA n=1 Tax=hydrothermal vent metagenome TaxID=652676 RepID=A0A3B1B0W9_9ZZZZ
MTIDMAQFHEVFFDESFEGLDIMESGLLDMDSGSADPEQINSIFRAAHSIKGGSGTFGFTDIASFTHVMETLLDEMRDGRRQVSVEAVNVLLASVDVLREMLTATREGAEMNAALVKEQQSELERILSGNDGAAAVVDEVAADTPVDEPEVTGWHVVFRPHAHMMRTGNDPLRLLRELGTLGDLKIDADISQIPQLAELEPEDSYMSWDLHVSSGVTREQVTDIFDWVEDDCDLAIMPVYAEQPAATSSAAATETKQETPIPAPAEKPQVKAVAKPENRRSSDRRASADRRNLAKTATGSGSIRVDISKIDSLINMVGELVITQSMLSLLGEDFDISQVERLREGLGQLERHTRAMQESVMQIRMLPISFTFSRFPRLVHDLSSKMGKKIELKMTGEGTEVDKTVIEKIGDPLVHLVRNSLDHGIEMPEERVAAGKPETGTVELNASQRGGNIIIEIKDDGKGLNRNVLLEKAVERGLVPADATLSDQQVYELIFTAGFSTAEAVSDVSGRGVGMDVVRRNINELGGSIEIQSELGKGSSFIIRLPLTLAILDGQTVSVGSETYIIPLVSIIESIQIKEDMVSMLAGKGETFKLRDEYLPIVRLHDVLGVADAKADKINEGLLVVVEGEGRGRRCGLFVDDLLGQQQVVIKSLEANYRKIHGLSGATILGDGSVALILDIPGLIRLAGKGHYLSEYDIRKTA